MTLLPTTGSLSLFPGASLVFSGNERSEEKIKQRERERNCVCVSGGGDSTARQRKEKKLVKQIEGSPEVELRVT